MDNKKYSMLVKECTPSEPIMQNILVSFIFGGLMGVIGNLLVDIYTYMFDISSNFYKLFTYMFRFF